MMWMRSMGINEKGGLLVLPSGTHGAISSINAAHGTTGSFRSKNTSLQVIFALRSKFKAACFMACIFSNETNVEHTTGAVMQFPSALIVITKIM